MISPSTRALILTTVLATVAGAPSAQAASRFDGDWVAHLFTTTGACEPNFRLSGRIVNGTANSLGAALRVAPSGLEIVSFACSKFEVTGMALRAAHRACAVSKRHVALA